MAPNRLDRLRDNKLTLTSIVDAAIGSGAIENPNAITRHVDGSMTYGRFTMTDTQLIIPEDVQPEELTDMGEVIYKLQSSLQWLVGDWMNAAERVWGNSYQEAAGKIGYEVSTVYVWASICRKVLIRIKTLSFKHHQIVAPLEAQAQIDWLNWAVENKASTALLREEIDRWKKGGDSTPRQKLNFSPLVTESERNSAKNFAYLREAIRGETTLTREEIMVAAHAVKDFADKVIRDLES